MVLAALVERMLEPCDRRGDSAFVRFAVLLPSHPERRHVNKVVAHAVFALICSMQRGSRPRGRARGARGTLSHPTRGPVLLRGTPARGTPLAGKIAKF